MELAEHLLHWGAAAAYMVCTVAFLVAMVFGKERAEKVAIGAAVGGLGANLVGITLRGIAAGHLPVKGDYENASAVALFIVVPAVVMMLRSQRLKLVGLGAVPIALFVLGFGLLNRDDPTPLTPAFNSTWLVFHVVFANLAFGAFGLAAGSGGCWLLRDRRQRQETPLGVLERLPDLDGLDDYTFRFVVFGFISCAFMIVAGSFWADELWGSYWNWDPVETWSLISWLIYGLFIHLRVVHKVRGRATAWLAVVAIVTVFIFYFGSVFFTSSFHVLSNM